MSMEAFRSAVEEHDLDAIMEVFAEEVSFHSPIVFKTYHGKSELRLVLSGVLDVLEDFRYVGEYGSEEGAVLHFRARIDERELDGIDMLHLRADGLCDDFTVMVRPYSAASRLRDRMAALLEAAG